MHRGFTTMQRKLGGSGSTWVMKELNPMDMITIKMKSCIWWRASRV